MKIDNNTKTEEKDQIVEPVVEKAVALQSAAVLAEIMPKIKKDSAVADAQKKVLSAYGRTHPELFAKKKTLGFGGGIQVTQRVTTKKSIQQDLIDLAWLRAFLSTSSADAISIKVDFDKIDASDPAIPKLLEAAGYDTEVEINYVVSHAQKQ